MSVKYQPSICHKCSTQVPALFELYPSQGKYLFTLGLVSEKHVDLSIRTNPTQKIWHFKCIFYDTVVTIYERLSAFLTDQTLLYQIIIV